MAKKSTQRALIECDAKHRNWTAGLVERSVPTGGNQMIRTKIDLFGFADIVAFDGEDGVAFIQACVGDGDVAKHVEKMTHDPKVAPNVARALARGNRVLLWSFRKVKLKRGGKAMRWRLRELRAALVDGAVKWVEVRQVNDPCVCGHDAKRHYDEPPHVCMGSEIEVTDDPQTLLDALCGDCRCKGFKGASLKTRPKRRRWTYWCTWPLGVVRRITRREYERRKPCKSR